MSFVAQENARSLQEESKKPIMLCDVNGTLLSANDSSPNQALITLLNHAVKQGFEVRICTSGHNTSAWQYAKKKLETTNIDPQILNSAGNKMDIEPDTFSGVVAIIDDKDDEFYIENVKRGNPQAQHFLPSQLEELTRHLSVVKSRDGAAQSA